MHIIYGAVFFSSLGVLADITALTPALIGFTVALNQGVIEQPSYIALMLMSLLTRLVVPLILRNWLYRGEKTDKRRNR